MLQFNLRPGSLSLIVDIVVVGEAGDRQPALELAEKLEPDVILMDLRMPKISDLEATQEVTVRILSKLHLDTQTRAALFASREGITSLGESDQNGKPYATDTLV